MRALEDQGLDRDQVLHPGERLLPDAADLHDLFDLFEVPVLLPVIDDPLSDFRADPGQLLELFERRRVEVDLFNRGLPGLGLLGKKRENKKAEDETERQSFENEFFHEDLLSL